MTIKSKICLAALGLLATTTIHAKQTTRSRGAQTQPSQQRDVIHFGGAGSGSISIERLKRKRAAARRKARDGAACSTVMLHALTHCPTLDTPSGFHQGNEIDSAQYDKMKSLGICTATCVKAYHECMALVTGTADPAAGNDSR